MIRFMLLLAVCIGAAGAMAQAGSWSRPGTWHMGQSHRVVEFNGRLWAVGGANLNSDTYTFAEIRSSTDGVHWTQEVANAPFGPRANHGLVVFNGRMWVLGGTSTPLFGLLGDVWSSPDGVNWTLETANPGWAARASHATLVHDNQIWVLGGRRPGHANDVWSSYDGKTWSLVTADAGWHGRYEHAAAVHAGRMWVLGGQSGSYGESSDVWSSADGASWTLETASPGWTGRSAHTVTVADGKLWLMGGGWALRRDIWVSSDGVNWSLVTNAPGWHGRRAHAATAFNNRLWVFGGFGEGVETVSSYWMLRRDAWSSADGASWQLESSGSNWTPRYSQQVVSFNGRMWMTGGGLTDHTAAPTQMYFMETSEVWSSDDGVDWTLETIAPFSPRLGHAMIVFNGRMWVIGGGSDMGSRDVWSSADGIYWVQETAQAPWSAREGLGATVYNNRIWITGGTWMGLEFRDVWSSADGVNWQLETSNGGFSRRRYPNLLTLNGRMWIIGGCRTENATLVPCLDIWSSTDGVNWVLERDHAPFLQRGWPAFAVFNNRIWMTGGYWAQGLNDFYSTADGVNWISHGDAAFPGRSCHISLAHDGKLWVIGGGWLWDPFNDAWALEPASPPQFTSQPPTTAVAGQPYTFTVAATGSPAPSIAASGLPGWLSLTNGVLTGTPDVSDVGQSAPITLIAINSAGSVDLVFSIDVHGPAPLITPLTGLTATVLQAFSHDVTVTGAASSLVATGLPAWLGLSGNTLSGTPGPGDVGQTGVITLTATNAFGTDQQTFTIDVQGVAPQITSAPVTTATIYETYSYVIQATGGPAPTLSVTGLPAWLSLSGHTLSGTPPAGTIGQTGVIEITASNGIGADAVQTFAITVVPATAPGMTGAGGAGGCRADKAGAPLGALVGLLGLLLVRRRRSRA